MTVVLIKSKTPSNTFYATVSSLLLISWFFEAFWKKLELEVLWFWKFWNKPEPEDLWFLIFLQTGTRGYHKNQITLVFVQGASWGDFGGVALRSSPLELEIRPPQQTNKIIVPWLVLCTIWEHNEGTIYHHVIIMIFYKNSNLHFEQQKTKGPLIGFSHYSLTSTQGYQVETQHQLSWGLSATGS